MPRTRAKPAPRGTRGAGAAKRARVRAARTDAPPAVGYSKRSRLDKLGVKPGMRVAVLGVPERDILRELRERTVDIAEARPRKDTQMILLGVESAAALRRLGTLQRAIRRDGAIWAVWPKGMKHISEGMIRDAAIAQGLADVKVIAFSEALSGLKLVIPLAKR